MVRSSSSSAWPKAAPLPRLAPLRSARRPRHRKQAFHRLLPHWPFTRPHPQPQRRILWTKGCAAGVAPAILIALPNLLAWVHHPTYELLNGVAHSTRTPNSATAFLVQQVNMLLIVALRCGSVASFGSHLPPSPSVALRSSHLSALPVMMMFIHAKDYYVAPIYPVSSPPEP